MMHEFPLTGKHRHALLDGGPVSGSAGWLDWMDSRVRGNDTSGALPLHGGIGSNCGWEPPIRARRLALSRSIRARIPSLTSVARSLMPDTRSAFASSSSSRFTVVLTELFPGSTHHNHTSIDAAFDALLDAQFTVITNPVALHLSNI